MTKLNFGLNFHESEFDSFEEYETVKFVISGISKILEYQMSSKIENLKAPYDSDVSITFYSPKSIEAANPFSERYITKRHPNGVTFKDGKVYSGYEYSYRGSFEPQQFKDLAIASVNIDNGIPFALPVYDIRKISASRVSDVRNIILDMYYTGLKKVSEVFDGDPYSFEDAYKFTKTQNWYVEKLLGNIVQSKGNTPSKVQLIARWEPDYIYHSARIFAENGSHRDILFMIYWRLIGSKFFNNPGRLSWVNKTRLKYIPRSREGYRFVFDINKGPIDFSYYLEPPRRRSAVFYSHLVDDHEDGTRNTLYLN